ncbi:hypothetical protein EVAR_3840_1 [Eumeta japonica]|uniref:Uncharacterized protein n=1 Tax=Eumeta variegata TaxID=151549 RepID=A0A4C1SQM0_EUMVA|nr:hypothetical protein EVAR_3840_1 [Eumeta japonica]
MGRFVFVNAGGRSNSPVNDDDTQLFIHDSQPALKQVEGLTSNSFDFKYDCGKRYTCSGVTKSDIDIKVHSVDISYAVTAAGQTALRSGSAVTYCRAGGGACTFKTPPRGPGARSERHSC